ncbi:hypothetical protein OTU49_007371 [Cherax quadricarinatus]|uniref:POLO box domain-containing protein n=1 Tax=Cherax quadricarinatus TaxID=27406 RepID=A0AAW0WVA4_CHEQU
MVIMKDSNIIDLSDTEVSAGVAVRTSEPNGSAPPPPAGAALAAAVAAAGAGSGVGGGKNHNMDSDTVITKPERPTVTFDPNPTIHLTNSDGSPVKPMQKDGILKTDNGISKSGIAPSITSGQQQAAVTPAAAAQPPKSDEPSDCYLKDLYAQVTSVVASKPDERENINEDECEDPAAVPMIWVSKWVDYSDKYGLGYQLCDDSIGVLFNDFTKLLLLADGENIHYIERSSAEHYHQLKNYPATLNKKVTLLRYFRNYMNEHLLKAAASMCPREGDELARIPSLRTYFRTRSAIILHLTNGTLQINFFEDHTKIILCPLMGAVTYIDEKRNFRTYRLASLEKYGCRPDLANRLRYARNMIQKLMVTKSSTTKSSSASSSAVAQQVPPTTA